MTSLKITKTFIFTFMFMFAIYTGQSLFSQPQKQNPMINLKKGITFFYQNNHAKSVYLKSSFDNWTLKYSFKKKMSLRGIWDGKWELLLPVQYDKFQLKKGLYKYKLVVDGEFISDPHNKRVMDDGMGNRISYFDLKEDIVNYSVENNPILVKGRKQIYRFIYKNYQAKEVYLVGSFNHWNAYSYPMNKKGDGIFEIKIKLPPGKYYYNFIVNDKWTKDPLNTNIVRNVLGKAYSYFEVKK